MKKIHVLDPHEAQKIAAGEVVERPANIVKELVENSIDAGAKSITIRIEKAGKERIIIEDDGCGMSEEDAVLCFTRHATSKLSSVDELTHISSFGFRGEALASVAAVSKVTLTTREGSSDLATCVTYHDGALQSKAEATRAQGTTIEIAQLFYSVPVRKAFLKQDETEWNALQKVVWGLALTHKHISFKLFRDRTLALNAPAVETLRDRLTQVWGHNIVPNMQDVVATPSLEKHSIRCSGLISQPSFWRYGRHNMFFFVNGRLVKNSELSKAVMKGYRNVLPPGRFPAVCLFLEISGKDVDVNIHPRKEEVRFTRPGIITRELEKVIKATLEEQVTHRLTQQQQAPLSAPQKVQPFSSLPPQPFMKQPQAATPVIQTPGHVNKAQPQTLHKEKPETMPAPKQVTPEHITQPLQKVVEEQPVQQETLNLAQAPVIIGQLFKTYILIQSGEELIIMDQHAAHERVLYHEFSTHFENKEGTSLLFPQIVTLTQADMERVLAHTDFFTKQGIGIQQAGPLQVSITSTPPRIQKESLYDLIHEMAAMIAQYEHLDPEPFKRKLNEHIHSHMACKAAVKAGDTLDTDQMASLVKKLLQTPQRFICVHGRPTMWPITQKELEKKFRRI